MGMNEAKKYITQLHRKQSNPYDWPDFLTGLPEKAAILTRLDETYPKIGRYAVSLIRITNIHPYLMKYGTTKHAEIIEWAAAILKTTADKYKGMFVGAFNSHDFVAIGKSPDMDKFLVEAANTFRRKAKTYYNDKDKKNGVILSFVRDDERVDIGLMDFVSATVNQSSEISRDSMLPTLERLCTRLELSEF